MNGCNELSREGTCVELKVHLSQGSDSYQQLVLTQADSKMCTTELRWNRTN